MSLQLMSGRRRRYRLVVLRAASQSRRHHQPTRNDRGILLIRHDLSLEGTERDLLACDLGLQGAQS